MALVAHSTFVRFLKISESGLREFASATQPYLKSMRPSCSLRRVEAHMGTAPEEKLHANC